MSSLIVNFIERDPFIVQFTGNGQNGVGVPVGGTAGQVLTKIDGTNFNTQWSDPLTVGFGEVVFGDPNTGLATSNPNFIFVPDVGGNPSRGYAQIYGAQVGNLAGSIFFRGDQLKGNTYLEIEAQTQYIGFYTNGGNERAIVDSSGVWKIYGGTVATDSAIRVDFSGVKVGPRSTMGTANSYQFEVQHSNGNSLFYLVQSGAELNQFLINSASGLGSRVTIFNSELTDRLNTFGVGLARSWGLHNAVSQIRQVMDFDGGYVGDIYYSARNHFFSGKVTLNTPDTAGKTVVQGWVGLSDSYPTIYFLPTATTPSISNYTIASDLVNTYFNAPSIYGPLGTFKFSFSGAKAFEFESSGTIYGDTTVPYLKLKDGDGSYIGYNVGGNNSHVWFGNNIARITSGRTQLASGSVATDYSVSLDTVGLRIGAFSNILTANNYPFEVDGLFRVNQIAGGAGITLGNPAYGHSLTINFSGFDSVYQQSYGNTIFKSDSFTGGLGSITLKQSGVINLTGVPTSAAGLSAGDVWNDLGTLKIV